MATNPRLRGFEDVMARVSRAALPGQDRIDVTLVAVSKTFPSEAIEPVLQAGHRVFGENRVQEAQSKWPGLKAAYPETELHLIGPLQSNKVKPAVELFDVIQTVDRIKLAKALAREMAQQGRHPGLFVQVNTGREPQKAGVMPQEVEPFLDRCRGDLGLTIAGLMAIPPVDADPRPHFETLREMAARSSIPSLSMGMSGDFETAIACGATHVRVGSAIFGARG